MTEQADHNRHRIGAPEAVIVLCTILVALGFLMAAVGVIYMAVEIAERMIG